MKRTITTIIISVLFIFCMTLAVYADDSALCSFTFDSAVNGEVKDQTGNLEEGILGGGASLASGISGNSVYFDGDGAKLTLADNSILSGDKGTVSFWIKPDLTSATQEELVLLSQGEKVKIYLDSSTKKIVVRFKTNAVYELISEYILTSRNWYHIVFTYDGENISLYINSKLDSKIKLSGNMAQSSERIYIGSDNLNYYKGYIDEFECYSEVWDTQEVEAQYNQVIYKTANSNVIEYPLKSEYPNGISAADSELFKNSKILRPINTGFEEINEISGINSDSYNGELMISEDKYTGKFALKVAKKSNDILPVKETDYFDIKKVNYESLLCNYIDVEIKPMYKSEKISFYTKIKKELSNGTVKEEYVLIKSDSDGDGIFKVGEDLSRGKWQKIRLSLLDIDDEPDLASGIYINANAGSEWLLDDVYSGYKKINDNLLDLSQFVYGNIVHGDNGLKFSLSGTNNEKYDAAPAIVSGGINISEKISQFSIEAETEVLGSRNDSKERSILKEIDMSGDECSVFETDYDNAEESVSKKIQRIYKREEGITFGNVRSQVIEKRNNESEFRVLIGKQGTSTRTYTIIDSNGQESSYSSSVCRYTDWYSDDITIECSYVLDSALKVLAVEYRVQDDEAKDVVIKPQGKTEVDLGDFSTQERTIVSLDVSNYSDR